MANKKAAYILLLFGNLAAAYAPGVFWLPGLPGQGASPLLIPLSPVLLFTLDTESPLAYGVILVAFLLLVTVLSALSYRFPQARFIVPGVLFAFSLIQGLLVARIVEGIDAIGHS